MNNLNVHLWGSRVGRIEWLEDRQIATFAYDREFLNSGIEISPVHMPLSDEVFFFPNLARETFHGLPGIIADSLPDKFGLALMDSYFQNKGFVFNDLNSVDRLGYVGNRGMGALEYEPSQSVPVKQAGIEMKELQALAEYGIRKSNNLVTQIEEDQSQGFQDILSVGSSAGGARAKAVIAYNHKTGEIRSGQLDYGSEFSHWIIKLDVGKEMETLGDPQGYGRIEYTYHELAKMSGINMAECLLKKENGRAHFMTRRFDRGPNGEKKHMVTLTGMRHLNHNDVTVNSYNQLFETARALNVPYLDREQLYRQMVFNVVFSNCDDHTKNFSFMLDQEDKKWGVSPAYDIAYSYDPTSQWVKEHMKVQGKLTNITKNDLIQEGLKHSIKQPQFIVDEIAEVSTKWKMLAQKNGISPDRIKKIQNQLNIVAKELGGVA